MKELSMKNDYWIEKHRYHELKHFCLQYPIWLKAYCSLTILQSKPIEEIPKRADGSSPVERIAEVREKLYSKMKMVEEACCRTTEEEWGYLLDGVTEGLSYDVLTAKNGPLPWSRSQYYILYRKFFYELDQIRD